MPAAKIAIEMAISHSLPTRNATATPMIEQATAPTTSEATGANSDSISAARISVVSSASALRVSISFLISM